MNLPGSAKTHLWVGLLVALIGVLVGGYAYTGDRVYDIVFLPVALVGLILLVGGSALAGYGQANRPRLGGRRSDDEDDEPGLVDRIKALFPGEEADEETEEEAS